jgi:hypothetical protein
MAGDQPDDNETGAAVGNPRSAAVEGREMYDLDFDFLKGQELLLLCFGPYTLTLHFDPGTQIQIEGELWHIDHDKNKKTKYRFPITASHLTRLLLQKIQTIETDASGKLTLHFSNDDLLIVEGRIGPYEAYSLTHQGKLWVI